MNTDNRFIVHHWGDPSLMDPTDCVDTYLRDMLGGMFTLNEIDNEWEEDKDGDKGDIYHHATESITEYVDFIAEQDLVIEFNIEMAIVFRGGPSKCTVDILPLLLYDPKGKKSIELVEFKNLIQSWDHWPCEAQIRSSIKLMCDKFLEQFSGMKFNFEIYT